MVQAKGLRATDRGGTSDPFCEIGYGSKKSRTSTCFKTLEPQWNATYAYDYKPLHDVVLQMFDHDVLFMFASQQFVGEVKVEANKLEKDKPVQQWYKMSNEAGKQAGEVELRLLLSDNHVYKDAKLVVTVYGARGLKAMDIDGNSDPYVVLKYGKQERRGGQAHQTLTPMWNYETRMEFLPHENLQLTLYDADDSNYNSDDFMGQVYIAVRSEISKGQTKRQWYGLLDDNGRRKDNLGEVDVEITWL